MNTILTKLAMLVLFLLAVTCGWAALMLVFPISLYNILLGILAAFFFLRAFELADKINKLGPYSDKEDELQENDMPPRPGPHNGEGAPDSDIPDEE